MSNHYWAAATANTTEGGGEREGWGERGAGGWDGEYTGRFLVRLGLR